MSGKCDELKDKWFNAYPEIMGIEGDEPTKCYGKADVDAAIDELKTEHHKERDEYISMVHSREQTIKELKQKLENVQASMYADVVDANMENRRLKRALYKACAKWAYFATLFFSSYETKDKWRKMKYKCLKKVEEYK